MSVWNGEGVQSRGARERRSCRAYILSIWRSLRAIIEERQKVGGEEGDGIGTSSNLPTLGSFFRYCLRSRLSMCS